jgi:hypothetical protein
MLIDSAEDKGSSASIELSIIGYGSRNDGERTDKQRFLGPFILSQRSRLPVFARGAKDFYQAFGDDLLLAIF